MIATPDRPRTRAATLVLFGGRCSAHGAVPTIDLDLHRDIADVVARAEALADRGAPGVCLVLGSPESVVLAVAGMAAIGLAPTVSS